MALAHSVLVSFQLTAFCIAFASLGNRVLQHMHWSAESDGEQFLVAAGVGVVTTEIILFAVQPTQHIKLGCWVIVGLLCAVLILERTVIWNGSRKLFGRMSWAPKGVRLLVALVAMVLFVGFLASLAPLTGSDALHYHFTVPKEILQHGFHPMFSISDSFLCGQHHLLILLGLALGSERLALGLIFLGGVLTAGSLACLSAVWARDWIAIGFTLLFLLTPIVFWQMCTSGAPDIYMAFLACTAVIVLRRPVEAETWRQTLLAGFLVGGIAGAKYTGCLVAAAFAFIVFLEFRSRAASVSFFIGALASGMWPYLRNFAWTGNPVFPLLSERLSPSFAATYAAQNLASNSGASLVHDWAQALPFLLFAGTRKVGPGFWNFFGPAVLVLAPQILLAIKNSRAWRIPLVAWFVCGLAIFFASGLPRFLLPIFPIALACVAGGFEAAWAEPRRTAGYTSAALLTLIACAGTVGLGMYLWKPLRVAIGMQTRAQYLEEMAPDYQVSEVVNSLLSGQDGQPKTIVFFRHLYYLNIPFVNGDPGTNFEVDPGYLKTSNDWKSFFTKNDIGYVVRVSAYPEPIAAPLWEMERAGDLIPFATADVWNIQGKRMEHNRVQVPVVILKLKR
jgi:Protein of unknown function (DUF1420)